jgi:hypothetical protein
MALIGPAGAGKTYTALRIASHMEGPVAVIDTEHGSASKYAGIFEFDVLELDSFSPATYVEAIHAAEAAGYKVLIIDSLSHAWSGKDGALEIKDRAAARSRGDSFGAWREVTPMHNRLIDSIVGSKVHIIATMRSKMEYVIEKDANGKNTVRKVGLQPVQREGMEFEFDVVCDLDQENNLIVGKTRCPELNGAMIKQAGKEVADTLNAWLTDGAPMPEKPDTDAGSAMRYASREEINDEVSAAIGMGLTKEEATAIWRACFPNRSEITLSELDTFHNALSRAVDKKLEATA